MQRDGSTPGAMLVCMNGDGPTTGFAVRVRAIAASLRDMGVKVIILRLYPAFRSQGSWRPVLEGSGIELVEIPLPPMARFAALRWLAYRLANALIHLVATLRGVKLVQAEAHEAGFATLLRRWSRVPVLVDFHGAAPEESVHRCGGQVDAWLEQAERVCVRGADAFYVVSPRMVAHLERKHGKGALSRCYLVPVNVEASFFTRIGREEARRRLGFGSEHRVLVYSGGAQEYQCIPETGALFGRLRRRMPELRLLVLTSDEARCRAMLEAAAPEFAGEIVYRSVPKEQVADHLAAADAAFLLRRNEVLNDVSCPTKFGEYLACGLPVVTTPWAGHAPALVQAEDVGAVVDLDAPEAVDAVEQLVRRADAAMRARCESVAREQLMWTRCEQVMRQCCTDLGALG